MGQGTGVGGFIGLEEPNLFGKAKRGKVQWQFGRNINDFSLSYTDPAFRESRVSGTVTLFNSRQQYTIGDLGRRRQVGGSLQVGFPLLGARYTRLFTFYSHQQIRTPGGADDLRQRFNCVNCIRSTLGVSIAAGHPDRPAVPDRGAVDDHLGGNERRLAGRHRRLQQDRPRRPLV